MINKFKQDLHAHFFNSPYFIREIALNLYGYFLSRRRFGRGFTTSFEFFQKTQWWTLQELEAFQLQRLRVILNVAYEKVPYYRKIFKREGLTPYDFKKISDLKKLPTLSKDTIRQNPSDFFNEDLPKLKGIVKEYSSGTTGQKFSFYLPKTLSYSINYALLYRAYSWAGVKNGDKRITIGGRIFTHRAPYWALNKAENQLLLSIHHLNENTVDEYISLIRQFSPLFLQGQPWGIYFVAERMKEKSVTIPLKAVFTTGESLYDNQREVIEEAFACPVYESYGLSECVIAAYECEEHTGFHTASELGIIEFEKDVSGLYRVIGTSLWNDVMPFIRYEIDDLVEVAEDYRCECGRGLPLQIRKIIGRVDDIIFTTSGLSILPVAIRMHIKPLLEDYESYQLLQTGRKEYLLLLTGILTEERKRQFTKTLMPILGGDAKLFIESATNFLTKGGKMRNVINLYKRR